MSAESSKLIAQTESPRGLGIIVAYLSKVVDPIIRYASAVSAVAVAFMMFITFANVIGRAAFDLPIKGYFESVEFGMVLMTVFGIGFCALNKGHIRVDVLSTFVSKKVNLVMDMFTYGIACVFYIFISWQGVLNGMSNLRDGLTSAVLYIPVPIFNFLLVIGTALVALVFLRDFLKAVYEVTK